MNTEQQQISWADEKGNLFTGVILSTSERFHTVSVTGCSMKRRNAKLIPTGTKYLVPKDWASINY